jgi:hypothetical protein
MHNRYLEHQPNTTHSATIVMHKNTAMSASHPIMAHGIKGSKVAKNAIQAGLNG